MLFIFNQAMSMFQCVYQQHLLVICALKDFQWTFRLDNSDKTAI